MCGARGTSEVGFSGGQGQFWAGQDGSFDMVLDKSTLDAVACTRNRKMIFMLLAEVDENNNDNSDNNDNTNDSVIIIIVIQIYIMIHITDNCNNNNDITNHEGQPCSEAGRHVPPRDPELRPSPRRKGYQHPQNNSTKYTSVCVYIYIYIYMYIYM